MSKNIFCMIFTVPCGEKYKVQFGMNRKGIQLSTMILEFAVKIGCKVEIISASGAHLNGNTVYEDMENHIMGHEFFDFVN